MNNTLNNMPNVLEPSFQPNSLTSSNHLALNPLDTLDLNLAEHRYTNKAIDGICFARKIALEIDRDPLNIKRYKNEPTIIQLCNDRYANCLDQTKQAEAIAYGDASVFLSCPCPSLAGGAMRQMADDERQDYFFNFIAENHCTTFAGITEPKHGSDVAGIETKVEKINEETYHLNGEKCFITHGADGQIGIIIAKTSSGPFGVTPVLITENDLRRGEQEETIVREFLPVVGMKGTCLSRIIFRNFKIPSWNILGQHLRVISRGMLAVIKTFNLMRPCVAGFVLGQAQGIVDYVATCCKPLPKSAKRLLMAMNADLATARENLHQAAATIQQRPLEPSQVSLAKAQITNLIEHICATLSNELNPSLFCEHPLLIKWFRDIYGFEYMEGTTIMQKRNIYQKYLRGRMEI